MYNSFYGLDRNPFGKDITASDYFTSNDYTNLLSRFDYLKEIKGIGLFVGSPGFGKTYAIRCFVDSLNKDLYKVIYLSPTNLSLFDFYKAIARELQIDIGACYKTDLYTKIQETIVKIVDEDKRQVIIIVDDAQYLAREILSELKVLFDFKMDSKDYTTILLVGHPNFKDELSKNIYETVKQRIVVNYKLSGLSRDEVKEYIKTRLSLANTNTDIFTEDALNALYSCSKSSPRRLNTLITNAFLIGYQNKKTKIDSEIVMNAKAEMDLE